MSLDSPISRGRGGVFLFNRSFQVHIRFNGLPKGGKEKWEPKGWGLSS